MKDNAKQFSEIYNTARVKYSMKGDDLYTEKEVQNMFKDTILPCSRAYLDEYVSSGMFTRLRGSYTFSQTPIHYTVIVSAITRVREKSKGYKRNWYEKKFSQTSTPTTPSVTDTDAAIAHLKSLGFRILRPKQEWEEL